MNNLFEAFEHQKVAWVLPNGQFTEINDRHTHWLEKNMEKFFDAQTIRKLRDLEDEIDPAIWGGKARKFAYSKGAIRYLYDRDSNEVIMKGKPSSISNNLDKLIVDNKNATYRVTETDDNGEPKKSGINKENTYDLSRFMKTYSGRRRKRKSKVSRFREIVREEVRSILRERRDKAAYWIDPSGGKHEVDGLHIEWLMDNRHKFDSIPDDFDTRDVMDPDYAQRMFIAKGWINVSIFKGSVTIRGTENSIRENLDELIFDNPNYKYTVALYDKTGEPVDEYLSMELDEFMKKFSGRKKKHKSKVSRFR